MREAGALELIQNLAAKTAFVEDEPFEEPIRRYPSHCLHPLEDISRSLGTVARCACGNDIARFRLAAPGDRNDVVPRRGRRPTVRTPPLEFFDQHLLGFGRDRRDSTPATMGVLASGHSEPFAFGIESPSLFVSVRAAKSCVDF